MSYDKLLGSNLDPNGYPFAVPPYVYKNNKMLTFSFRTDPALLRLLVPAALEPNPEATMVVYVGALHIVKPEKMSYDEAGFMIPVTYQGRPGTYLPVLYLDEIVPLVVGREVWGFNKAGAKIYFEESDTQVKAGVISGDTQLIELSMFKQEQGEPRPNSPREHILSKRIPSVKAKGLLETHRLNTCRVTHDVRHEVWLGPGSIKLGSTTHDPLAEIPIYEIVSTSLTRGDLELDYGDELEDLSAN